MFQLNANQHVGNYWIRAQPNSGNTTFDGGLNSAILRYNGAPKRDPTSTLEAHPDLLEEADLRPLSNLVVVSMVSTLSPNLICLNSLV